MKLNSAQKVEGRAKALSNRSPDKSFAMMIIIRVITVPNSDINQAKKYIQVKHLVD